MDQDQNTGGVVQLHLDPVDKQNRYLGNAHVAHAVMQHFANAVIAAYDQFLQGKADGPAVQRQIGELIAGHADVIMGRDQNFEIAPWQGERFRGKFLAAFDKMKGGDDPGKAFFDHYALQLIKASMALANGASEDQVGAGVREIILDGQSRILGVI